MSEPTKGNRVTTEVATRRDIPLNWDVFVTPANDLMAKETASVLHRKTACSRYGRSHRSVQEKIRKEVNCPRRISRRDQGKLITGETLLIAGGLR